jgi:glyoxylase-like metal-dependent hydrolase (beta-lactamase superfamily II)
MPTSEPATDLQGSVQRWTVGDTTITSIVEAETAHIPPEFFFTGVDAAAVRELPGLVPDFADADGNITLRVQALVVDQPGRRVLVDPCVGNGKRRALPFWHEQSWPFMERLAAAGFDAASIDLVVHTHLHADHVGWDTHLVDGSWIPTFTGARHLYTSAELEHCRTNAMPGEDVYGDSVGPIVDAGLADIVDPNTDLGNGLRLEATPGHTPGHVSLWIESSGDTALITGDFVHHPAQLARPGWAEVGDDDAAVAETTRRRMFSHAAEHEVLLIGTHFPTRPAGRIVADGEAWKFLPGR